MPESAVADFAASFKIEENGSNIETRGRVLLSQRCLVLAVDSKTDVKIPLSTVLDIKVKDIPSELGDFFDDAVKVAYERNDNLGTAVIKARKEAIEKFSVILFKTSFSETDTMIKHPAQVGGRVTDQEFAPAKLSLQSEAAMFTRGDNCTNITLESVTDLTCFQMELAGSKCHALNVQYMKRGQTMTTTAAIDTSRKMSLLRRYFRLRYSDRVTDLTDIEVSSDEKRILVAIHSIGNSKGLSHSAMVDKKPQKVATLLNSLQHKDLIVDTSEATKLTRNGLVIVNNYFRETT